MIKEYKKRVLIELEYELKNKDIINQLILGKLNIREAIKQLNKNLGNTLVNLSELKHK